MRMIFPQKLPLYFSFTNYTKFSKSMRTFRETPCSLVSTQTEAWQFHITHAHNYGSRNDAHSFASQLVEQVVQLNEGGCRDVRSEKKDRNKIWQ